MLGSSKSAAPDPREPRRKGAEKPMDPRRLGLLDNEDVRVMMQGCNMVKVRSSRWQKSRNMRLLDDGLTVWCESTKSSRKAKAQQTFAVTEVECVREGCQSEALRRLGDSVPESKCFTVVFRGARKSLDLLCPCEDDAQRWVRGLRSLKDHVADMTQNQKLDQYPAQLLICWNKYSVAEAALLWRLTVLSHVPAHVHSIAKVSSNDSGKKETSKYSLTITDI